MAVAPAIFDRQTSLIAVWTGETGTSLGAEVGRFGGNWTIQATGTGTVTVFGSNLNEADNVWVALNTTAGAAISLAAGSNAMAAVLEHPARIRVVVTGGTATVALLAHGSR